MNMGPILLLLRVLTWAIILRAVLSWFRLDPEQPLVRVLTVVTDPILRPLQMLVPPRVLGGIDISPILALVLIQLLFRLLLGL